MFLFATCSVDLLVIIFITFCLYVTRIAKNIKMNIDNHDNSEIILKYLILELGLYLISSSVLAIWFAIAY